jgi:hypothetical protein
MKMSRSLKEEKIKYVCDGEAGMVLWKPAF